MKMPWSKPETPELEAQTHKDKSRDVSLVLFQRASSAWLGAWTFFVRSLQANGVLKSSAGIPMPKALDMDKNTTPSKLLKQVERVTRVWMEHPELRLNGGTLKAYRRLTRQLQNALNRVTELKNHVRAAANQRDQLAEQLNDLTLRARATLRGHFGPDSIQYGMAGGTRRSERRKRRRKETRPLLNKAPNPTAHIDQDLPVPPKQAVARKLFLRN